MNSMYGSPDFARFVANRMIQDQITDAQAQALGRQSKREGRGSSPRARRTSTKHHVSWLFGPLRPAH